MTRRKYFLPLTDSLKLTWYENFYLKLITSYVLLFGLTTAEKDVLLADLKAMMYTNLLVEAAAKFAFVLRDLIFLEYSLYILFL